MTSSTQPSPTYRQQQEQLAEALVERARRDHGGQLDLLTWAIIRRPILQPGVRFDLQHHHYLRGLYQAQARELVVYKASQMGASEYAVSYALHAADERQATILYVFPTDTHVSDFSSARIGPAIEASAYLGEIVVDGGAGLDARGRKVRGADRVTLKRIRDRFLYLRGGQVKPNGQAPQLKSIPADCVILDEVDEMDSRVPAITEKRLGHSAIKEMRWISTPTYPGMGVHAKWLESDMREWFVRCEHCGEWQPLTIHQVVLEFDQLGRPRAWRGQESERAWLGCSKCGRELNRLADGEWVATHPTRAVVGFHLTKLFSAQLSLLEVVKALDTTDETKRRETYNQDLGETYTPRGGKLTDVELDHCRRDYAHGPVRFEDTFMGVDVGKVLHVVIRGPLDPETGERAQRWAGEVESFEDAGRLIGKYNVKRAVFDALPETRKARELQAGFAAGRVWLAYYVQQKAGTKNTEPAQWDHDNGVVNLDRTRTLDQTFSRFYDQENSLPGDARSVRDYYDHLKAPVRVLEDGANGQKLANYVEDGADHFAHAENYCTVASTDIPVKVAGVWGRRR